MSQRQSFVDFVSRATKEGGSILLIAGCVFLTVALLSFDARDPGWSHLGYDGAVKNLFGLSGAWVADVAFSFVGYLALALPLLLVWRLVRFFLQRDLSLSAALPYLFLRLVGGVVFIAAASVLCTLHLDTVWKPLPFSAGGMVGIGLSREGLALLGLWGMTLVSLALGLVGLGFYAEFSWLSVTETVGAVVLDGRSSLQECWLSWRRRVAEQAQSDKETAEACRSERGVEAAVTAFKDRLPLPSIGEAESVERAVSDVMDRSDPVSPALSETGQASEGVDIDPLLAISALDDNDPVRIDATASRTLHTGSARVAEHRGAVSADDAPPVRGASLSVDAGDTTLSSPVSPVSIVGPRLSVASSADDAKRTDPVTREAEAPAPSGEPLVVATASARDVVKDIEGEAAASRPASSALKIVPLSQTHHSRLDDSNDPVSAAPERPASLHNVFDGPLPSVDILDPPDSNKSLGYSEEELEQMSRLLEIKLKDFGVVAEVVEVNPGPVITRFEIQPAPGVKVSKISNLAKDLARSMAVLSVRVVEIIAGKSVVGIEIPNENREVVRLSEVLGSSTYKKASSRLSLGLGNDIGGNPVVVNLAKMPHLLVAGTTGSGKSVGVNAMLISLLLKARPDEVRLMMVDPKMLELSIYEGIPHLLTPVITDMKEAAAGLRWCVAEMERRYKLMAKMGVRNLAGFNDKIKAAAERGEGIKDPLWNPEAEGLDAGAPAPDLVTLPYIVVVIDEFADMMMIVGKKVEELIARIAQKARAAGIHLILATQRPSVDVITGLIKANVPTRIAFQVSSRIDSRTILDQGGAENLLGNGDMLYLPAGTSMPDRVHGAFVADDEVHRVVEAWKQLGKPDYIEEILMQSVDGDLTQGGAGLFEDEQDALYDEAVAFVTSSRRASISAVQRKLKIGYNRAARLVETMEAAGVVSEQGHNGNREVLAPPPVQM